MNDDGFHEIQLNGKQLVFMFMLATVVLVATFLSGVLVGRGVRVEKGETAAELAAAPEATAPTTALQEKTGAVASSGASGSDAAVPLKTEPPAEPPQGPEGAKPERAAPEGAAKEADELSYYNRLEGQPPPEKLKPSPANTPTATTDQSPETRPAASASRTTPEPAGDGFAVQIAALRERSEAEALVRRLAEKGYPAYVMEPPEGAPAPVFRIRVGKFRDRREAEEAASRLEKEEQFKPWIIR